MAIDNQELTLNTPLPELSSGYNLSDHHIFQYSEVILRLLLLLYYRSKDISEQTILYLLEG